MIKNLYRTILDALFPRSTIELDFLSLSPEETWRELPRAPSPPLSHSISIFAYKNEKVSKLIWNIKYKKNSSAMAIGGYALYQALSDRRSAVVIPMPITRKRRNERGYNQCELLADEIKRLDGDNRFVIVKDLLLRARHSSRQTLKNRENRMESAKGVFTMNNETIGKMESEDPRFKDRTIVVIDDVITTGSTMKEAIETLRMSGFEKVSGLSLAH